MENRINLPKNRIWLLFLLLFTISGQAQTIVKVIVDQPAVLEIVANNLFSQTASKTILGEEVTINGGELPYHYSWLNNGLNIGTSLLIELPTFTPSNSLKLTVVDANNCSCTRNTILTDIDDINRSQSNIKVYPNPASNFIIINPLEINGILDISIFNTNGLCALSKQIVGKTTMNINLPSGLYLVRIENKNDQTVILKKLVIL